MGFWIFAASCPHSTCTTNQIFLHSIFGNWSEDIRVFADLFHVVDCRTDAHTIVPTFTYQSEFWWTKLLVKLTRRTSAIELPQIRIVDFLEGSGDRPHMDVEIVSINIAHVIEIWSTDAGKGEFHQSRWGLPCYTLALDSKVIERAPQSPVSQTNLLS